MRWVGVALLGLAATAIATPRVEPRPTWADWVGDYEGTLAWKGCFTPGAARARIALDAIDGAMFIDLVDAGGGLRSMSLVEEEGGWSAHSGDVKLRVQRPRDRALYLDAEIGSDCRMQAQLVRATTKIAACDRLIGWARIEGKCSKLTDPRLQDVANLATESRSWKPRAKADAARCEQRAEKLATSLVDAGCAPLLDPYAFVPGPECQALGVAVAKLRRCVNASYKAVQMTRHLAQVPLITKEPSQRAMVEAACARQRKLATSIAQRERCPL
jgi:hypothetical protein